jgi:lysophospholipase L1-like esterase
VSFARPRWPIATTLAIALLAAAPPTCAAPPPEPATTPAAAPLSGPPPLGGPSALSGAEALAPFFAALAAAKAGRRHAPVQILQIGDSHTASDYVASGARVRLQARFGEGGRGVLPPGTPFGGYAPFQIAVTQSDGWRVEPSHPAGASPGPFGLSGWRLVSTKPGASITLTADPEAAFDQATVCGLAGPGEGALAVSAGAEGAEFSFAAPSPAPLCRSISFAARSRQLLLTAQRGPVTLTSFGTSRATGGVMLSNLGISGAELGDFAARDDAVLKAELAAYAPDLIILAFGTNEGFNRGFDAVAYEPLVRAQIRRLKALAPRAAILLLGPADADTVRPDIPEDGVHDLNFACAPLTPDETAHYAALIAGHAPALARWYPPPTLGQAREAQRRAAATEGAAFWDWNARIGGACSAHRLSRPDLALMRGDHVHFTSDGGDLVGAMLARDLIAAYDAAQAPGPAAATGGH